MKSVYLKDHELVERMDDEQLEKFRSWLKRLVIKEPTKAELNREAVKKHRDKIPHRRNIKPQLGKVHRCGVELTDTNTYYDKQGRLACRTCDIIKARRYVLKKMAQNLYRNLEHDKLHSRPTKCNK